MLGYVLDEIFVHHRAPSGHPERPARLEAVRDALAAAGLATRGHLVAARPATDDELHRVHAARYVEALRTKLPGHTGWLDPDTYFSPESWDAATRAAGGTAALATGVMSGELGRGLAVVRPPGHHATADRAMGFCLLNNVAVAAAAGRAAGAARVAILVWDVHHGNGTQDIFWNDPSVLYLTVHQFPYDPGTGAASEVGGPAAPGTTVNVGLPAGSRDRDYHAVFDRVFIPALERYRPDLIVVSAGFDAHQDDPLAGMRVTRAGFAAMAHRVRRAADALCGGRLVVALEGGYDLGGLAGGMTEVLEALVAEGPADPVTAAAGAISPLAEAAIAGTEAALAAVGGVPA